MEKENPIEEARRYVANAEEIIKKSKYDPETKSYKDKKYVRIAGDTLWKGSLIALDAILHVRTGTREFGISAGSLGLLSSIIVAGFVVGRFPTIYLRNHYSVRSVYLFNASFVLLSAAALVGYYLITGSHSATGVIAGLAVQAIGFSGMAILSLNNCLLTSGEAKGAVSGLYNFMNQGASLLGILLVQLFFAMGLSGIQIFQTTLCLLLAIALLGTWLFLKTYPNYKNLIE